MYIPTLSHLVCSTCRTPLRLTAALTWLGPQRVDLGAAACGCQSYSIEQGILDMYPSLDGLSPAQASNLLPLTAWGYERFWRPRALSLMSGEPFSIQRELAVVVEMLQPSREGIYLDLACSTALQARGLARHWATQTDLGSRRVVALDFSQSMLREAGRLIRREGWQSVDLARARGEALPFADASVAGLVCGGSLNELGAPWAALTEARRVTQPEGRAVFMSILTSEAPRGRRIQRWLTALSGLKFWSAQATQDLFTSTGWSVIDQRTWGAVAFTACCPNLSGRSVNCL